MKAALLFFAIASILILSGCRLNVPVFDSASVEMHSGGGVAIRGVLSDLQLKGLRQWLNERRTGWEHRIESTAPALLIRLEHRGKVIAVMNIMQTQVKVGDLFRPITPGEHDMLSLLLTTFLSSKMDSNTARNPAPGL